MKRINLFRGALAALMLVIVCPLRAADAPKEVKLDAAQQAASDKLRAKGAAVMQIAADTDSLAVNLSTIGKQASDEDLALIKTLPKVQELDLHNTGITDAGLANIAGMTTLVRLHLNGTAVTDAGLAQLKALTSLEYLNLYGTAVSDAGLKNLDGLKKLKRLYLWQTKVTDTGAKDLKSALPELVINRGEELALPAPATKPAVAMEKPKAEPKPEKPVEPKKAEPAASAEKAIDGEGFIRAWLVLGPIQVAGDADIDKQKQPNEKDFKPKEGDKLKVGDKEIAWKKAACKDFYVDLKALLAPDDANNMYGYAVAYLESSQEKTGLTLLMGSNDEGKVYLNGKEILKSEVARNLDKDSDKAMNITLNKGINVVVFKVINETNNWQACLRFTDKDGKPVTDLKVNLAP